MNWELVAWNALLTLLLLALGFIGRSRSTELDRVSTLLAATREEMARNFAQHVTRAEIETKLEKMMDRVDTGFLRIETKIDKIVDEQHRNAHNG